MLTLTKEDVVKKFVEHEIPIHEISLVEDPATHEKWNVIAGFNGNRKACFMWDESTLNYTVDGFVIERAEEEARLYTLKRNLRRSTTLQSPLPR